MYSSFLIHSGALIFQVKLFSTKSWKFEESEHRKTRLDSLFPLWRIPSQMKSYSTMYIDFSFSIFVKATKQLEVFSIFTH